MERHEGPPSSRSRPPHIGPRRHRRGPGRRAQRRGSPAARSATMRAREALERRRPAPSAQHSRAGTDMRMRQAVCRAPNSGSVCVRHHRIWARRRAAARHPGRARRHPPSTSQVRRRAHRLRPRMWRPLPCHQCQHAARRRKQRRLDTADRAGMRRRVASKWAPAL